MPLRLLKLVRRAKEIPEVAIALRILTALVGLYVMIPAGRALLDPSAVSTTDWVGVVVFTGVGLYLLVAAARGRWG